MTTLGTHQQSVGEILPGDQAYAGGGVFATLLSVSITKESLGSALLVTATAGLDNDGALAANNTIRLAVDGVAVAGTARTFITPGGGSAIERFTLAVCARLVGIAAGARAIQLQWTSDANTLRCRPAAFPNHEGASIMVAEVTT